VVTCEIKH